MTVLAFSVLSADAAILDHMESGTATSNANQVVTVTTVKSFDPSKTFLVFSLSSNSNNPMGSTMRGRIPTSCTNPCSTLEFERVTNEGSPGTINIQWYVAMFVSGVCVQRGDVQLGVTLH